MLLKIGGVVTAQIREQKDRQNREKSVFYPFSEVQLKILDELIEESRKEIFEGRPLKNGKIEI